MNKKKSQPTSSPPGKGKSASKSKPGAAKASSSTSASTKWITENRKAKHRFEILESVECGLILVGSEVKSLRDGKCSLDESYGRVKGGELWLVGCDIPEYKQASFWNHEPKRPRKLLMHRREMNRFLGRASEKGFTLVPLRMYFNERGKAKCVIGLCKGLKVHDKRETLKKQDAQREIQRAVRRK